MSDYDDLAEIDNRKLNDPDKYFGVVFAGRVGDYDALLVAEITKGEEAYWNIAKPNQFDDLQEAYRFRDFLRSGPVERIRMMRQNGVKLFPNLTDEERASVMYIENEPIIIAGGKK